MNTSVIGPKRVFISYAHYTDDWENLKLDAQMQRNRVFEFAERLRDPGGIHSEVDQYYETSPPVETWPRWMRNQIKDSDFVLVVCTPTYYKRFHGEDDPGVGQGADWEGAIITQQIYDDNTRNLKFIPIGFAPFAQNKASIPDSLRGRNYYDVSTPKGFEDLLRHMTSQHRRVPSPVALAPVLPQDNTKNPH